jgi:hypothetical protein
VTPSSGDGAAKHAADAPRKRPSQRPARHNWMQTERKTRIHVNTAVKERARSTHPIKAKPRLCLRAVLPLAPPLPRPARCPGYGVRGIRRRVCNRGQGCCVTRLCTRNTRGCERSGDSSICAGSIAAPIKKSEYSAPCAHATNAARWYSHSARCSR